MCHLCPEPAGFKDQVYPFMETELIRLRPLVRTPCCKAMSFGYGAIKWRYVNMNSDAFQTDTEACRVSVGSLCALCNKEYELAFVAQFKPKRNEEGSIHYESVPSAANLKSPVYWVGESYSFDAVGGWGEEIYEKVPITKQESVAKPEERRIKFREFL